MAAELEQLRKEVVALSKKFRVAGQSDLADLLSVDARGFGVKTAIAKTRGLNSFAPAPIKDQTVTTRPQKAVEQPFFKIPEELVIIFTREIGGKSVEQLETEVRAVRNLGGYALDMMHNPKFEVLQEVTPVELGKLPVHALGLRDVPTTRQIFERIPRCRVGEYVLELCRAEVGPHQAIADKDQPLGDCYYIMHEPITDRDGLPDVFVLERGEHGLWLYDAWALPGRRWDPVLQLVFALRNIEPVKA